MQPMALAVSWALKHGDNGTVLTLRMGNLESTEERDENKRAWERGLAILADIVQ